MSAVAVELPHPCEVHIDNIRIEGRHRKDLGDIDALAKSIADVGLIQPVVVLPNYELVAGERRVAALRQLGGTVVPVTIINTLHDAADRLKAERDENRCRKDFTASELVALGKQLEDIERPKAKGRQRESGRRFGRGIDRSSPTGDNLSHTKTDDIVGDALGISATTYRRAKNVVAAANDADPVIANTAKDQLAKLDAGRTSVTAAAEVVKGAREAKSHKGRSDAKKQLRALDASTTSIQAIADGLETVFAGGFEQTCTPGVARSAAKAFREQIKRINVVLTQLDQHGKAQVK